MKIAVISDTHFGFGWGTDRQDDAFLQAREAFEKALDCDIIVLGGDLFDRKIPSQEVWKQALPIFSLPVQSGESTVNYDGGSIERELSPFIFSGIPVVAIHGTHERRAKGFVNPIELLEQMGYLVHLHGDHIVFEKRTDKGVERVAIHGMSGVPERYAPAVLKEINPQPVEDCYNVLLLHQSIEGFVYTEEGEALTVEDLPTGFDAIIDGHIHWMQEAGVKNLLFPGSTITTQLNKVEAEVPKGFMVIDTTNKSVEFVELEHTRPFIYHEAAVASEQELTSVGQAIEEQLPDTRDRAPLVRVKLTTEADISQQQVAAYLPDDAITSVTIDRHNNSPSSVAAFHVKQETAREQGVQYLEQMFGGGVRDLFTLLAEGEVDGAITYLQEDGKELLTQEDAEDTHDQQSETE